MKFRNIITGITAIIAGIITIWRFGTSMFGILSGVNVAVIITIGGIVVGKTLDNWELERNGFKTKDELSQRIEARAGNVAFQVGNYIWLALLYYEFLSDNWLPTPTIGSPAIIIVGIMGQVAVNFAARAYYGKNIQ